MSKPSGVLHAVAKGKGGVKVSHNKNTAELPSMRIPSPERVVLPMQQHIGAPCVPTVKPGEIVGVGQVVGDTDKYMSAPIHASISGKVTSVGDVKLANGLNCPAVTIESDGEMRLFEGVEPPKIESRDDFFTAIRASGLVGLGGAGFPTHVKIKPPAFKQIDTLVVNAAECEPFITVDYRECIDNSWDVMSGIYTLKEFLGVKNVVIAIEDNKPEAFRALSSIERSSFNKDNDIKLMTLKSRYPQGAEKMMVLSATGRKVPIGKLPADVGCIVMNVASVAFISRYLKTGKPLVSRSVTVDGSAIKVPMNVRIPIGIRIQDVIDFCGGFVYDPIKIISGGPMMGKAIFDTSAPMLKSNNAILAFAEELGFKPQRDCIRCGKCVQACPMGLMPTSIAKFASMRNTEMLQKYNASVCMECGCCAFSCPSGQPLVQYMSLAKQILREESKK